MCAGALTAMGVTAVVSTGQPQEDPAPVARAATTTTLPASGVELKTAPEEVTVAPGSTPEPTPAPRTLPEPLPGPVDLEGLAPGVRRGVAVFDLGTGEELFTDLPDEPFPAASVIKLLIALDALESGTGSAESVTRMLATSSDGIANRLWRTSIPRYWATRIGLTGLVPPPDPYKWGDALMTARDVVAVYRYALDSPWARLIVEALEGATPVGEDGFDQTFGIPDALGDHRWGVKQGWACCYDGFRALNTTGVVDGRYVVAVLTRQPSSTGYAEAGRRVTALVAELAPLFGAV